MSTVNSNNSDEEEIDPEDEEYDVDLSTIKDLPKIELPQGQRPASKTQEPEPNPSDALESTTSSNAPKSCGVAAQAAKPCSLDDPGGDDPDFPPQSQSLLKDGKPTPPQPQRRPESLTPESEQRTKSIADIPEFEFKSPRPSPGPRPASEDNPFSSGPWRPPQQEGKRKRPATFISPQPQSDDDPSSTPPRRPESVTPEPEQKTKSGANIPELSSRSPPNDDDASAPPLPPQEEKKRKRSATPNASGSSGTFNLILSASISNSLQSL